MAITIARLPFALRRANQIAVIMSEMTIPPRKYALHSLGITHIHKSTMTKRKNPIDTNPFSVINARLTRLKSCGFTTLCS